VDPAAPTFTDILGQPKAVQTLRAAMESGRVHHAWIFTGPMGVGKHTAARAFASMILDPTTAPNLAGELEPDPSSQTQRLIATGVHPDLHLVHKELARYSEEKNVRERKLLTIPKQVVEEHLLKPIALAPSMNLGGMACKVFIVDEAERLDRSRTNAPTQNSMLKTLEEPPAGSVIILVTSAEENLLPTIRSRCQRVVFTALDEPAMEAWMKRAGIDVTGAERRWLLEFAEGSPGKMMRAIEGGMYAWSRELEPMLDAADRGKFDAALGPTMAKLVDEWAKSEAGKDPQGSKEAANFAGARAMLSLIAERARKRLRDAASRGEDPSPAVAIVDAIDDADRHIAANVSLANAFENLAVQISSR
jgi:DNA polymerase III subunit delta'